MKGSLRSPAIRRGLEHAKKLGYRVEFRDLAVDSMHPALVPPAGFCDPYMKLIVVGLRGMKSKAMIAAVLAHELEHAAGKEHGTDYPEFDLRCGGMMRSPLSGEPL